MEKRIKEKQFKNFIHSCYKYGLFLDEDNIKFRVLTGEASIENKLNMIKENLDFCTLSDLDDLLENNKRENQINTLEYKELISLYFQVPISSSFNEITYNIFVKMLYMQYNIRELDVSKSIALINNLLNSIYYSNISYEDKIELINCIDDKIDERFNALSYYGIAKSLLSKFPISIQNKNLYYWYKNDNNYKTIFIFDLDNWNYDQLKHDFLFAVKYADISPYLDSFLNNATDNKLKLLLFNNNGNINYGINDIDIKEYVFSTNFCRRLLTSTSISKYFHIFKRVGYIDKLIDELKGIFHEFLEKETISYYGWLLCYDLFNKFTSGINELDKDSQELLFKYNLVSYCGGIDYKRCLHFPALEFDTVKLYSSDLFNFIKSIISKLDYKMYFDTNFKFYYTTLFRSRLLDLASSEIYKLITGLTDLNAEDIICNILKFCNNIDQGVIEFAERKTCYMTALIKNKKLKAKDKRYLKVLISAGC